MPKITFVPRKINKNCCRQNCTFSLQYAPNRLSAGVYQTTMGELTAFPQPLAVFSGPTSKGRDGEEKGGEERRGRDERRTRKWQRRGGREGVRPLP